MAEPHDRKPILTIEQQIEHLKQKGVAFELCSEEEAADYLRDKCNFFKLASYRKLFSKYEGGPRDGRYVDLDFGQLRLLAALDQELRHALLGMTLDIEHFQKVTLLREMEDRGEDGYAIVADYMASLTTANREYRLRELKMSGRSPYSSSLYAKYSGDMPAWAFPVSYTHLDVYKRQVEGRAPALRRRRQQICLGECIIGAKKRVSAGEHGFELATDAVVVNGRCEHQDISVEHLGGNFHGIVLDDAAPQL